MKNVAMKTMMAVTLLSLTTLVCAQNNRHDYLVRGNQVEHNGHRMPNADARSFTILGHGYAKDFQNVYYNGEILPFVDPQSFRLRDMPPAPGSNIHVGRGDSPAAPGNYGPGTPAHPDFSYMVMPNGDVLFNGKLLKNAYGRSFKDLGGGYGKDNLTVFYMGKEIKGAFSSSFQVLADGYSKDSSDVYYLGNEIRGAMASSFKVDGRGYAHDTFNTYYKGKEVK